MAPKPEISTLTKRYYTISEVAEMFDVSKSLIRFWEQEFSFLKPHKNSKGDRRFTQENIEQLSVIYELVKERGFTLAGAKQEIKSQRDTTRHRDEVIARLQELRSFLVTLRDNPNP